MFQKEKGGGMVVWPTRSVFPTAIQGKYLALNKNIFFLSSYSC